MNKKQKGSVFEREIIKKFWQNNWAAFRAAGSGSSSYPCPDIIAGNSLRKLGIESKIIADDKKYFSRKEIEELKEFCHYFGAEAWIVINFQKQGTFFFSVEDLKETKAGYTVSIKDSLLKGFTFEDLIKIGFN